MASVLLGGGHSGPSPVNRKEEDDSDQACGVPVAAHIAQVPKEELPELLQCMVAEIGRIRGRQPDGPYDLIHSHYWISTT
jgi:hypothetical protein